MTSPDYPPPPWHTHGRAFAQPYLVDARALDLPAGVTPVTLAGRAVGILALIEYLPPSPLSYAELIWMPCMVRAAGKRGYFVDRMYVDSAPSLAAGRAEWALPKQLADFAITDTRATITTDDGAHLVLELARRSPGVPTPVASGTLQSVAADGRLQSSAADGTPIRVTPGARRIVGFRGTGRAHVHSGSLRVVETRGLAHWRGFATARRLPAAGAALSDFAITMHEPRTLA